ncbi:single-stranded DNA-binding protein [Metallibacterium scheffleri]|uniref:Single-stranded DNA-binding protein n=1 Tax=Metallibacterium scheffleri TaxID=993689 RepID=A0A4S3KMH2_9GAMM|nr:single-stranded DNA-binding protein [Metallibacterium scheffleri]THD10103.1 hypothetical protein B1806_09540 [Metallibacterium scheffleri]
MNGVNRCIIAGRLGADVEYRTTASGSGIASLRVATTARWKDKQTGEMQERTEWHRIKLFGRQAEIAKEYLSKGSVAYFEGSLQTDKYTGKDGIERYTTSIIASDMQMLGSPQHKNDSRESSQPRNAASGGGSRGAAPAADGTRRQQTATRTPVGASDDDGEFDDIPFFVRRNTERV